MERNQRNMAEPDAPAVKNWWTLFFAVVLGLVVAVIYNVHIRLVRQEGKGDTVNVLRVNKDLNVGDQLKPEYIDKVPVPADFARNMRMMIEGEASDAFIKDTKRVLSMPLKREAFLTWDLMEVIDRTQFPSWNLSEGMVGVPVQLDPKGVPGELLRPGDHVNIVGIFNTGGKLGSCRIVEGVRVLEVGYKVGKEKSAGSGRSMDEGVTNYREIAIELPFGTAIKFKNVLTHASSVSIEVRKGGDTFPINPQISKDLEALAGSAAGGGPTGPTGGGGG